MKNDLTASYVRELFDYDTKTGNLIWKVTKCNRVFLEALLGVFTQMVIGQYLLIAQTTERIV